MSYLESTHPYLQLDPLLVAENGLHLKVDAHRADVGGVEGVVGVAEEDRGFAHAAVADDQQLEHVVEVGVRCVVWRGLLPEPRLRQCHLKDGREKSHQ